MKLKERIKTYNFWVSLASAMLLLLNTIGKRFNFSVDENLYNDLFTSFCGVLVLLGIIVPPSNQKNKDEGLNGITDETRKAEDNSEEIAQNGSTIFKDNEVQCSDSKDIIESASDDSNNSENLSKKIDEQK